MDNTDSTLRLLIDRLQTMPHDAQGVQSLALAILYALQNALRIGDTAAVLQHTERLNAFWVQQVPWCSSLSKDLEKLLIQLEETVGSNGCGLKDHRL